MCLADGVALHPPIMVQTKQVATMVHSNKLHLTFLNKLSPPSIGGLVLANAMDPSHILLQKGSNTLLGLGPDWCQYLLARLLAPSFLLWTG